MTRVLLVAAALVILVLAGVGAAAMPPVPYFSQCDSRWGSDQMGGDGPTICSMGCALTSAAMVMAYYGVDTDPQKLNDAIGRGGYDGTYCIKWSAVRDACHDETNQIEYSPGTVTPFDETVLDNYLDSGHPVIVYVYCPGYGGYWGGHFVVVTGRSDGAYYINDPASSTRSTLAAYPTRYGMRIFSGSPPDEGMNKPLIGDWNGNETDTTGIYNYTTAEFSLDSGLNISFGISGDIPITGDWNRNGYDTIGVFRPSTAQFFLDYDNDGVSDMNATFGVIGDIPVAGDWDGDGDDNIGVFRQNHSGTGLTMFFLDLDNSGGSADQSVAFGEPDDLPVIGDWDGDGDDNIGLYRTGSTTGVFYLDIDNDGGAADIVTPEYGDLGDIPIAGDWDGDGDDNIGVYRPGTGEFFMDASLPEVLPSKMIYVDDDFSDDPSEHGWDTIQEGVDDATDGDTVIVYAGTYYENVIVNKSLILKGIGMPVVDAGGSGSAITVSVDGCVVDGFNATGSEGYWGNAGIWMTSDNNIIINNTVSNNEDGIHLWCTSNNSLINNNVSLNNYYGIYLYYSSNNTLTSNTVDLTGAFAECDGGGIYLHSSSNNTLANNNASNNYYYGIYLDDSNNNTLTSNNVSNNDCGIYMEDSSNNTLQNNTISGNWWNFAVFGKSLSHYIHNIDTRNTVNGKTVYYWVDQQNKQIPCDAGFVEAVNCTNITVKDLVLTSVLFAYTENSRIENVSASNNYCGIHMLYSSNNTLIKNIVSNNDYGIYLRYSSNNTLANNNASNNDDGIYLYSSSNNTITGNTVNSNDDDGIYLYSSSNNTLSDNTINSNNCCGIYLFSSSNNTLTSNAANSNDMVGICFDSSRNNTLTNNIFINDGFYVVDGSYRNTVESNTVNGKPLAYHEDTSDITIQNAGQVILVNCTNITVENLNLSNTSIGVELCGTDDCKIANNTVSNNTFGIFICYSSNNLLTRNTASNNEYGIFLWDGVIINNTLYHNNLINNTQNTHDFYTNTWDSGSEGNYYSDYNGTDPDGDGIGNDPHPIPGGSSIDYFPLMQPWTGDTSQKGDLNSDGILTPADAAIALRMAVRGEYADAADVSRDGRVTSLDALMIMQAAAEKIEL